MRQNLKFDESLAMKKAENMKNSANLPKDDIKITRVPRKSEFEKAKDQYQQQTPFEQSYDQPKKLNDSLTMGNVEPVESRQNQNITE